MPFVCHPKVCTIPSYKVFTFFPAKSSSALLERWDWEGTLPVECNVSSPLLAGASMWRNSNGAVHMAHLNVGLLEADNIDTVFSDAMGGLRVSDVSCYLIIPAAHEELFSFF